MSVKNLVCSTCVFGFFTQPPLMTKCHSGPLRMRRSAPAENVMRKNARRSVPTIPYRPGIIHLHFLPVADWPEYHSTCCNKRNHTIFLQNRTRLRKG